MKDSAEQNDPKKLIELAKNGDTESFGALYELYFTPVFRYIYRRTKNKHETEDLTQTVFLKAYRAMPRFEVREVSPLAYFFTIARNTVIQHWKKNKKALEHTKEIDTETPDSNPHPGEIASKNEKIKIIHEAIETLTPDQQEIVALKFIEGLPNQEIAQILGKTEEAIRQLQCRALKTLRKNYGKRK